MNNKHITIGLIAVSIVGVGLYVVAYKPKAESVVNYPSASVTNNDTEIPVKNIDSGSTVNLSSQDLVKVPMDIFSNTSTNSLDLSNNQLTGSLPAEIRMLINLKNLDLSNNKFTGVPAEIGQLSKLENLNLSGNPITGLPNELGNLKNLKVLDLTGTNYSAQDLAGIKNNLNPSVIIKI